MKKVLIFLLCICVALPLFAATAKKPKTTKQPAKQTTTAKTMEELEDELFAKAIDALDAENYAEAAKHLKKLAEMGNPEAQYSLGMMYYTGQGVPQNYTLARELFASSAEAGISGSMNGLGYIYGSGFGVKQDTELAVKWYRKAAELGDAEGQYNMGVQFEKGEGVPLNLQEALKWYRLASEQDDEDAQLAMLRVEEKMLATVKRAGSPWFAKIREKYPKELPCVKQEKEQDGAQLLSAMGQSVALAHGKVKKVHLSEAVMAVMMQASAKSGKAMPADADVKFYRWFVMELAGTEDNEVHPDVENGICYLADMAKKQAPLLEELTAGFLAQQ